MRIRVDAERCTGHGRCYALAPQLIDADEDGHGVVSVPGEPVPSGLEAAARRAVANCPEDAVRLRE